MRIGILQPGYLPWLGLFEQMHRSDAFVIYDDVQYDKHGWRNRNRIKTASGVQWLTVPVSVKYEEHPLISEVTTDNKLNWRKKHLSAIQQSYSKVPFYKEYAGIFEEAYSKDWEYLIDIDMYFITKLSECLGMGSKKIIRSSTLDTEKIGTGKGKGIDRGEGNKMERLARICRMFDADIFYEGASGRNYIDTDYFARHGIKVEYQDYKHPVYKQLYNDFVPYLSVIDLLFNHGEESLSIIIGRGKD